MADWSYNESEAEQSTTQTAWQDAVNLTFTSDAGDYIVVVSFELGESEPDIAPKAQLIINGVSNGSVFRAPWDLYNRYNMGWIKKITFTAASQTIKVQYATSNSSYSAYIRNIHIFAWKASTFQYSENETEQSFTTTETTLTTLTFTPASAQNYLILASFEGNPDYYWNTSKLINFRLKVDGIEKNLTNYSSNTDIYRGSALMLVQNLTAASHTITITGQAEAGSSYSMYARRVRVAAIPLSTLTTYNSSDEAETSTDLETYQDKLNYSTTISTTANHVVFGSSENKGSDTSARYNNLKIDGVQSQESIEYSSILAEYVATFSVKNLSLASGSHTFKIQHKGSYGITVYTKNARILVIQQPPAPALAPKRMTTKGKMSMSKEGVIELSEKMTPSLDIAC